MNHKRKLMTLIVMLGSSSHSANSVQFDTGEYSTFDTGKAEFFA